MIFNDPVDIYTENRIYRKNINEINILNLNFI